MTPDEAEQLALDLMEEHGLLHDGWSFAWSSGKRQLGKAEVRRVLDERTGEVIEVKKIRISRHLVDLNTAEVVRDTILHEIAHAIAGIKNGHNEVWREACRKIGAKPERLAGSEVRVASDPYRIVCTCCDSILDQRYRRVNPRQLQSGFCNHCGPKSKGKLEQQTS